MAKLAATSVGGDGGDGASGVSEGVMTRGKSKLAETIVRVYCTLGPADNLVSLVRSFLLLTNKVVKEQVRSIAHDNYEIYLSTWQSVMAERPHWKKVQDSAEHGDYKGVLEFLGEAATFMD